MRGAWLVAALLCGGLACKRAAPPPPARSEAMVERPRAVELTPEGVINAEIRTARLTPGAFAPRLTLTASITSDPQHLARVGARVSGRVAAVRAKLGDRVRKGDPLVELDSVELHEVTLDFFTARARARAANDALARQRQLTEERVGALQDLRRAESEAAAANAALKEAEEHLHFLGLADDEIRRLRTKTTHGEARSVVRAPIDGRVTALNVTVGQVLTGNEDIVTIAELDPVWVALRVYERDLPSVTLSTPVEVRVPSYPDRVFTGAISFVGDIVDPITRTVDARAPLANGEGLLRPGMSAVASVPLKDDGEPFLPVEAVQPYAGEHIVFVRTGERRFEARSVTVGEERGGTVPVKGGLRPEDDVVVHGALALRGELERAAHEE